MKRLIFLLAFAAISILNAEEVLPRTVVALYDSRIDEDIWFTQIHQYAEMPLNHLGLRVEYYDICEELPEIASRPEVAGALVWFPKYTDFANPDHYLKWVDDLVQAGKKFVVLGAVGFEYAEKPMPRSRLKKFWDNLGLIEADQWIDETYELEFPIMDRQMVEFERKYQDVLTPFHVLKAGSQDIDIQLMARVDGDPETDSVLVCTGPCGGFIAEGYAKYSLFNSSENFCKWYVNPFLFLKKAFGLERFPVPDTTTLFGKRIYYSHIDGDGWNSITELEHYRRQKSLCAEVVFRELIEPYPDLPVTVSAIAADLDPAWVGKDSSQKWAREIFALDQVEAASHTYSHPFNWGFFKNYQPQDEVPYLGNYVTKTWEGGSVWKQIKRLLGVSGKFYGKDTSITTKSEKAYNPNAPEDTDSSKGAEKILENYDVPRAYANFRFDLDQEVRGSVEEIELFTPPGKKVELYQWSGDCQPFEKAVALSRALQIPNINGGDSRFDSEFYSYAWVRPLSRNIGDEIQVYTSCSNENTYTDLWRGRFFGFKQLPETWENTEQPLRISPINVYYHMYSGEKLASLNAVKYNLEYAKKMDIIPIEASLFAKIVDGFYSCEIFPLDDGGWKIKDRGELQTVRFDKSSVQAIDFDRSKGVIGFSYLHGSLYAALDPSVKEPVIYLIDDKGQSVAFPVLTCSSWRILRAFSRTETGIEVVCKGYGPCKMEWRVPVDGKWRVILAGEEMQVEAKRGILKFSIGGTSHQEKTLTLKAPL